MSVIIGSRIKKLREKLGITQERLDYQVDKDRSCIHSYEKSKRNPELSTLCKLARVLDCSVDYLLGFTGTVHRYPKEWEARERDLLQEIENLNSKLQKAREVLK